MSLLKSAHTLKSLECDCGFLGCLWYQVMLLGSREGNLDWWRVITWTTVSADGIGRLGLPGFSSRLEGNEPPG